MSDLASVEVLERDGVPIARVTGELDLSSAPETGEAIEAALPASAHALVVDFSELGFMDSSGVSVLFRMARRLADHRQELHVVAPPGGAVARVPEVVEFGRAAPVHASLGEALDQAKSSAA